MFAKSPLFIKIKLKDFKVQNFKFNYKILINKITLIQNKPCLKI